MAIVSLRSSTDELEEMKIPDSGLGFLPSSAATVESSSAEEGGGSERNSSWSRMDEGGVGGQVENQFCMLGMSGHDELS